MSINWEKAKDSPNSKQKVKGKHILELKQEISDLENQLTRKEIEIKNKKEKYEIVTKNFEEIISKSSKKEQNLKQEIDALKNELKKAENKLKEKTEKLHYYSNLEPIEKTEEPKPQESRPIIEIENSEDIINEIKNVRVDIERIKANIKNEFKINKAEISQINQRVDNLIEIFDNYLPETNNVIQNLKKELRLKDKQIQRDKEDLNHAVVSKDNMIGKLESDLTTKINELEDLNNTIEALYTQISEVERTPEILKQIIDIMEEKGELSKEELEEILETTLM
ncbi:MAG: hypothetical protein GF317_06960 [Candidatus Lokiarchaeota archaeon]|nr:hypothetical protein [Candidatus Lokiarchaeota archaeon]MBD3199449.1 hypothetical protein [Candidatus Lokiarchaeota archaeon]